MNDAQRDLLSRYFPLAPAPCGCAYLGSERAYVCGGHGSDVAVVGDWPEEGFGGCQGRKANGAKCTLQFNHEGTPHRFCRRHPHEGYCTGACFREIAEHP